MNLFRYEISDPIAIAVLWAVFAIIVWRGQIAFALGIFLATHSWIFNVDIGPLNMLWLAEALLVGAALSRCLRGGTSVWKACNRLLVLQYLAVVGLWTTWILVLYWAEPEQNEQATLLMKNFCLYSILPSTLTVVFVSNLKQLRQFVHGFIGVSALTSIASSLISTVSPESGQDLVRGFDGVNYITYSFQFAIAILLCFGLLLTAKRAIGKSLLLAAMALFTSTLLQTGARASAIGVGVAVLFISWWTMSRRLVNGGWRTLLYTGLLGAVGGFTYLFTGLGTGVLYLRWKSSGTDYSVRTDYWSNAFSVFSKSPLLGRGITYLPDYDNAHNILLDLLASQGIVGFLLLLLFGCVVLQAFRLKFFLTTNPEVMVWKTILASIFVFTAIHTQTSGSVVSISHFFWAPALLMQLASMRKTTGCAQTRRRGTSIMQAKGCFDTP
jgi:O-antigen ligase